MEELFNKLCLVEEKIEENYLFLVETEFNHRNDDYGYYLKNLKELLLLEEELIQMIINRGYINELQEKISSVKQFASTNFALGHITNSYFFRLINLVDRINMDLGTEYVFALKYDINKIILRILEELIDNPAYEDIREDLIYYKFNLIYLNYDSESDFVYGETNKQVELKSDDYRKQNFSSSMYLDLGFLVLFSKQDLDQLYVSSIDNKHDQVKVISYILDFLARLTLCRDDALAFVIDDVQNLMISDELDLEVKEIVISLLQVFEEIKDSLVWKK